MMLKVLLLFVTWVQNNGTYTTLMGVAFLTKTMAQYQNSLPVLDAEHMTKFS